MSGDFETLEINQSKITYLKQDDNNEWLDKIIKNIEDLKNNITRNSQSKNWFALLDPQIKNLAINQKETFVSNAIRRFSNEYVCNHNSVACQKRVQTQEGNIDYKNTNFKDQ